MKKDLDEMSEILAVRPVLIDSSLFSAQEHKRNYWTYISFDSLSISNSLVLKDTMDSDVDDKYFYTQDYTYHGDNKRVCATLHIKGHDIIKRVYSPEFKSPALTSCRGGNLQKKVMDHGRPRKLTPHEYRKLQTIPEWYQMNIANSHIL